VSKPKPKTRWTREFKLRTLARMDAAADVTARAKEFGVHRRLLYAWRRKFQSGGADALHQIGHPLISAPPCDEASVPSSPRARQRAATDRGVGAKDRPAATGAGFFLRGRHLRRGRLLRHFREQCLPKGGPGGTPSTR